MPLADLPKSSRPREKLLAQGAASLSDAELLALLLRTGLAGRSVLQMAQDLLDRLGLTELATSIPGLSAVGAAAILAETGDPSRFASARALVKHAGLAPRERLSGNTTGRTRLTGQGRPALRLAAWRAVWGTQRANPVYAARYLHLTTREHNRLKPTQAQAAIAAAILRQLHAVITTGRAWDPAIAAGGHPGTPMPIAA